MSAPGLPRSLRRTRRLRWTCPLWLEGVMLALAIVGIGALMWAVMSLLIIVFTP